MLLLCCPIESIGHECCIVNHIVSAIDSIYEANFTASANLQVVVGLLFHKVSQSWRVEEEEKVTL